MQRRGRFWRHGGDGLVGGTTRPCHTSYFPPRCSSPGLRNANKGHSKRYHKTERNLHLGFHGRDYLYIYFMPGMLGYNSERGRLPRRLVDDISCQRRGLASEKVESAFSTHILALHPLIQRPWPRVPRLLFTHADGDISEFPAPVCRVRRYRAVFSNYPSLNMGASGCTPAEPFIPESNGLWFGHLRGIRCSKCT